MNREVKTKCQEAIEKRLTDLTKRINAGSKTEKNW